jgi:hypothetical protein
MTDEKIYYCKVGDVLEVKIEIIIDHFDDSPPSIFSPGDRYKVIALVDHEEAIWICWDLEKLSGTGPEDCRVINNNLFDEFKIIGE